MLTTNFLLTISLKISIRCLEMEFPDNKTQRANLPVFLKMESNIGSLLFSCQFISLNKFLFVKATQEKKCTYKCFLLYFADVSEARAMPIRWRLTMNHFDYLSLF